LAGVGGGDGGNGSGNGDYQDCVQGYDLGCDQNSTTCKAEALRAYNGDRAACGLPPVGGNGNGGGDGGGVTTISNGS